MKSLKITGILVLLFMAIPFAKAQTNSVEVKDGLGAVISSHNSITAALASIPLSISQPYIIELTSSYTAANESYPITLLARSGASATNTITIRPAAGAGAKNLSSANQIFHFNDADYVYIDGREGGVGTGSSLTIMCTATGSTSTILFDNGATYNKVSYCTIFHGSSSSAGRGVHFSTSVSNPSGNSYNTIEYCDITGGRYRINSSGTAANPNRKNTIKSVNIMNITFAGIWAQANTAGLVVDSCTFQNTTSTGNSGYFILFDSQLDTAIIRNSTFKDLQLSSQSSNAPSIYFRTGVSGNCYSIIYNNFISYEQGNTSATNLSGISFEGTNGYSSQIYNNTIKMGGVMGSVGTSGNVVSTCLKVSTTNASTLDIKNNLFLNTRSGGNSGVLHTAMNFTNTATPINADFNTYNSTQGTLIRYGTTNYSNLATWQGFVPAGNEQNSNTTVVQTTSGSDLHLAGSSIGDLSLIGSPISFITRDIDGQLRNPAMPYRGADEAAPVQTNCSGNPGSGSTTASLVDVCMNGTSNLGISGIFTTLPDLTFQWQSSPDNITYTNIAGANADTYQATITGDMWYRVYVTCTTSVLTDTMSPIQIQLLNPPTVGGISVSNVGDTYTYTATGVTGTVTNYLWDLGNGQTSTSASPVITYTSGGPLTVSVTVSNACGTDVYTTTVQVGCSGTPPLGTVVSSTLSACINSAINLSLTGIVGSTLGLTYQWESSTDGINFTPIPGATNPNFITQITQNTFYRCVITCSNSGLSITTADVEVTILPAPTLSAITFTNTNNQYDFSGSGITGNPNIYSWDFGDGASSTDVNPTHTYTLAGTYAVTLTVTNSCGSATETITVNIGCTGPANNATTISSALNVCLGDPITLSLGGLNAQEALTYTYQWQSSADGVNYTDISGATNSTYSTTVGTDKYYRCMITCPQYTATASLPVSLNQQFLPAGTTIHVTSNGLVHNFSLGLTGNFSYMWSFGDGATNTSTSPQHTYSAGGTYQVRVIVTGPCGVDTLYTTVSPFFSLENHQTNLGIQIYPNPTNDIFMIESNSISEVDQIKITDMLGKTVYVDGKGSALPESISTKSLNLDSGIYFITIHSSNISNTFKLIVN